MGLIKISGCIMEWSVGTPTSCNKSLGRENQGRGATSGSSREQSDDEDIDTEAGPCEQSTEPNDLKRMRRCLDCLFFSKPWT